MAGGALANAATFFFEQGDLAMFDLSRYLAHTVLLGKTAPRARLTLAAVDVAAAARFGTRGRNHAADVALDALVGEVTTDALLIALISGLTLAASDAARARAFLRRRSRDVPAEKGLALRGLAATLASPPTPRSIAAGLWALALEPDLMRLPLHQVALRLAEGLAGDPRSVTPLRAGLALMLVELARRAGGRAAGELAEQPDTRGDAGPHRASGQDLRSLAGSGRACRRRTDIDCGAAFRT